MKTTNIGQLKNNLSSVIDSVQKGETVTICKRNIPIATLIPHESRKRANRTKLDCGKGTVKILGDVTEPMIPESDWDMHQP